MLYKEELLNDDVQVLRALPPSRYQAESVEVIGARAFPDSDPVKAKERAAWTTRILYAHGLADQLWPETGVLYWRTEAGEKMLASL